MYICMYVCLHVYACVCEGCLDLLLARRCVCMYSFMYVWMHGCMYVWMYVCVFCMCVCLCMYDVKAA